MIAVINYGVGNLKSIVKALEFVGGKAEVVEASRIEKIASDVDAIVFPGVGAFKSAITKLSGVKDVLESIDVPILGICLGMQLFATESTEGGLHRGLNWVPGKVVRFPPEVGKIPHMGWNEIDVVADSEILDGVESGSFVYFVHSYYLRTDDRFAITKTEYGFDFVSGVERKNCVGFQFHPEKSGEVGLKILSNFVRMVKK